MKARLHNYFEFVTKEGRKTFYNTLLPGLNQKFLGGETFSARIAFGKGSHGGTAGISSLSQPLGEKECALYDCNFDPSKGLLFVKKYIELAPGEFDGEIITEAGFVSSAGNLVNYAAIPGGIPKPEGEGLLIVGTLLLELSADVAGEMREGENPLIKLLLGEASHLSTDFALEIGGKAYAMQKAIAGEKLTLEAHFPQQSDFRTAAVSAGGKPCIIFDAAKFPAAEISESVPLSFDAGGAMAEGEGLISIEDLYSGGVPVPFSSKPMPSGAADSLRNPFQVTVKREEEVAFSPNGRFMAVFGGDILSVYDAEEGLRQLDFSFLSFAYSDLIKAVPDDKGNLFALISKPPYVRVFENEGGTLYPCGQSAEFPQGITEFGLSQHGGKAYLKCSTGAGSQKAHFTFMANISNKYYTHQQTFFAEGYVKRFYSPTDDGEITLDLATGQLGGNRQVSDKVKKLLERCQKATLCGKLIYVMEEGRWRLYTLGGEEIPLYDSGIRKLFVSGSGNIVKLYANNALSGCFADGRSGRVYNYPIDVKPEGEVTGAAVSDYGIAAVCSSKHVENHFIPLKRERLALFCEGLEGQAEARIIRRSFKNFSSKKVSCELAIEEV